MEHFMDENALQYSWSAQHQLIQHDPAFSQKGPCVNGISIRRFRKQLAFVCREMRAKAHVNSSPGLEFRKTLENSLRRCAAEPKYFFIIFRAFGRELVVLAC